MLSDNDLGKQVILIGNITLSQNKPAIERVLSASTVINITQTIVQQTKVVFTGELIIDLQYVARVEGDTQPLHFASFVVPFADFLKYEGLSSKVEVSADVEFQEYLPISEKELRKTVILQVFLKLEDSDAIESLCHDTRPINCCPRNPQCYENTYTLNPHSCCYAQPPCHQYSSPPDYYCRPHHSCYINPCPPNSCPYSHSQVCVPNQPHSLNPHTFKNATSPGTCRIQPEGSEPLCKKKIKKD